MTNRTRFIATLLGAFLWDAVGAHAQPERGTELTIVRSFVGGEIDGAFPVGAPLIDGNVLYGMTHRGGATNWGTIFKMNKSTGSGALLHSFDFGAGAALPDGSLISDGTYLYGVAPTGDMNSGEATFGMVFRINTDAGGFTPLHWFNGAVENDDAFPHGSLTLVGTTLYGMTQGLFTGGTIFKVNTDGTGYAVLHVFNSLDPNDGWNPSGDLTSDGTALYGMTPVGGAFGLGGTIFKINLDGSGFTLLHSFPTNDPNEGTRPNGSLLRIGTTLYGATPLRGGPPCNTDPCGILPPGTIFRINTDGSGYTILHAFSGSDGYSPGSLASDGELLYGSAAGLLNADGMPDPEKPSTLFQIRPDGTCFRVLHTFAGAPNDAAGSGRLTVERVRGEDPATTLYGMGGGGFGGLGAVFRMPNVNQPLEVNAGPDQIVEATSPAGALVNLSGGAEAEGFDYRWTAPSVVLDAPDRAATSGVFPLGQTVATLTINETDCAAAAASDDVLITVQDTSPPAVSCTTTPTQLFPPDHQMIAVRVAVCATDATTLPAQMTFASATARSNERDNAPGWGDGDTVGDTDGGDGFTAPVNIAPRLAFNSSTGCFEGTIGLRAERAGTRRDRVYTISAGVSDANGVEGQGSCSVVVPHN